jgi:hypothetical protein
MAPDATAVRDEAPATGSEGKFEVVILPIDDLR